MCNRPWRLHTCGHRWMLPLIRCEQPTGKVMTAGHILNIPHGSKPADVPPEPSLPSSGKTSKASKKSRKLPGAPVVQMITPQTSPSATVTPALHPNAAFTSDPTFTVDPTPLVAIPEASLASHPFNSDPNHAVNNIENLIGVPCNDCLDKAAEQQAIARSKSKRRARRNKKYDDDYYLNAEGGMDDTMRDPNGEPICEIPEKARWQEGNKPLVVPTIAGVEKASWTKKRRRLSGGKQPRPQIRRSRRNSEANKNDDNSENGLEEDGEPRRKTKPPSKWALRMQSERERKKAAEEARAEVARKDAQARQQTAIDSSRGTLKICQTSYSPAPAAGTNSHDHDGVIAPSIDTAIAPSSSHTSVTPASSNILTLTSSHTSQTSHSGRILFEPVTEHDPKNQPVSEDDQPTLRSNYLKEIQEIRKKTRNTFKLEDEAVSRQWTGNKGRAGKLNAMYHRLASTYQSAPGNPSPYELAEQELAQKRAGAEGAAADSQQSPTASRPATAPRPAQRGSSKREKKQDRDQQPQEEPPSVEPDATTVAPRAVMRAPAAHSRAEDGLRSSRQEQRQKQKGRGSKKRAEQLAAEAAIAKARADLLAAEARAAAFESTDDSPERTEAVAAQRQTNPPCGGYDSQRHSQYAYSESFRPHRPMHENEDHQAFPPHRALRHGTHDPYLPNYNSGYAGSSPYLSPYEGHGYHHNPGYRCGSTHGYDQNLNAHQTHPGLTREHSFPPEALPHPGQRSVYPDPIYAGAGAYVYGTYGMQHDMRRSASSNPAVHPIVGRQGRTAPSINRQGLRDQPGHSTNVGTHGEQSASLHDREADLPITLAPTSNRIGSHRNTNGGDLPSSHGEHFASTSRLHVGLRGDLQASFRTSMAGPQLPGPSQGPQSHTHTHNDDDHSESQAEQHQQTTAGQLEVPDAVPSTTRIDDAEGSEVSDNEFHRSSTALMAPERYSTASRYPDGSTTYDATRARLSSVRSSTPARTPAGGTPAPVAGTASSSTITAKNTHKSRSPEKGRNNRKGKSPHKRTSNDNDTANLDDQYDDSTSSRCKRPATSPASAANTNATMQETLASHRTSRASVRRIMYAEGSSDVESEGENNDAAADDGGGGVIGGGGIRGDGQQRRGAGVGSRSGKGEEVIVDRDAMEIEREDGH